MSLIKQPFILCKEYKRNFYIDCLLHDVTVTTHIAGAIDIKTFIINELSKRDANEH